MGKDNLGIDFDEAEVNFKDWFVNSVLQLPDACSCVIPHFIHLVCKKQIMSLLENISLLDIYN